VSIQNAPKFHVVTTDVNRVTVWGVKLMTPTLAYSIPGYTCAPAALPSPEKTTTPSTCFQPEVTKNTDGIDPGTSQNVTIAYTYISTGDDNVALKSGNGPNSKTRTGPASTNHLYAHNRFYYGHGMSIGSETDAGIDGVKIWDLVFDGQDNANGVGLRIKSDANRGGVVQNVLFQNVCMRRIHEAIVVSPYYESAKSTSLPPDFHDITMKDIHYVNADSKFNRSTLTFSGYQTGTVTLPLGITLDNVVFDTAAVLRKGAPNHDVQFKLGPGPVVGVPLNAGGTVTTTGTPGTTPAPVDCNPGVFVKFPTATSPI
jgi:polygalacturonase